MDLKEFIFILLIVAVTCVFTGYFTYRILNTKLESLINTVENLKHGSIDYQNREEFINSQNSGNAKFTREVVVSNDLANTSTYNAGTTEMGMQCPRVVENNNVYEDRESSGSKASRESFNSSLSSVTKTQNEVDLLKKELEKIETLIESSSSENMSEGSKVSEDVEEATDNVVESTEEEINNDIVDLVDKLEKGDDYHNSNMSEFEELANVGNDKNSELNDLIRVNDVNNEKEAENTESVASVQKSIESISKSSVDSRSIDSGTSKENTNKNEYENIAKQFIKTDLKDICKQINISQKGNKLQLIEKIFDAGRQDLIMLKINA